MSFTLKRQYKTVSITFHHHQEDFLLPPSDPFVQRELNRRLDLREKAESKKDEGEGDDGKDKEKDKDRDRPMTSSKWKGIHMDLAERRVLITERSQEFPSMLF